MLVFCRDQWNKNKDKLEAAFRETDLSTLSGYQTIFEMIIQYILNDNDECNLTWDTEKITRVDDGDYQGTMLFVIPLDTYQPSADEYLMAQVGYGSCSGCDTFQNIQPWDSYNPDEVIPQFMSLAADIISSIVKPFNGGWRMDERFQEYVEPS